jgi:hypothetical protein
MKALAYAMRVVGSLLPLPENYRYESLRVMAGVTYGGDSRKAERELGWSTRPLAEGLPPTLYACMRELGMPLPDAAAVPLEAGARGTADGTGAVASRGDAGVSAAQPTTRRG